jgi:hypothetical protein
MQLYGGFAMVRFLRWMVVPSLLGLMGAAAPVTAQNRSEFVNDEAGFFSKGAKDKANAEIARMGSQTKHELVVDTVVEVKVAPEIQKDKAAVNRFFDQWAEKRFVQEKVNGVYIAIVQNPPKERVQVGNKTMQSGLFTSADRKELEEKLLADLKTAHAEVMKNQAKNDRVLLDVTSFVHERMVQRARELAASKQAAAAQNPAAGQHAPPAQQGTPWVMYILIGIGVLLVLWLIMGVMRALSGAGGGAGPGMGYGGGGGGGFFSSLMGGLFGAAAGMWLYNNVFGGHTNSAWGAGPDGGGANTGNDADTSSTGGGDDYGDTGGGAGGDQGGDVGGGGDWGGGGGDWGGGGGDFGGGGGGGDW